jgi:hypothetical protein
MTAHFHETPAPHIAICQECGRWFDLLIDSDAEEWYYGHDCES